MNQQQTFSHPMFGDLQILIIDGKEYFPATESASMLGYTNPHKAVIDHCRKDGLTNREVIDSLGRTQQKKFINEGNLYRLIVRSKLPEAEKFEKWVFDEVLPSIRKTGSYTSEKPKSQVELMLMYAKQFVEVEKRMNELEASTAAAHHRIDNFDKINVIGDLQQRLNKMIRKYATNEGLTFQQAWRNFRQAFNTAYRTNITMLVENYKLKHGLQSLTMPEYLSKVERLDDAIRVADKLLNKAS